MTEFDEFKEELLSDPSAKKEYDALGPEYDIIQAMIDARVKQNITQKELSERTGITQADISRIERGTQNMSLAKITALANYMETNIDNLLRF